MFQISIIYFLFLYNIEIINIPFVMLYEFMNKIYDYRQYHSIKHMVSFSMFLWK